ncbi:hypothetical protein DFH08DRAFT_902431 [Mycena albidolilacea]|uniref:Secreted protein n=1 Tax=Mycena albidolilacea TaxID=1033008 RepID=A0AAD7E9R8_9AGAR|nr:hypothetical protein DFH08DRAFT_902431 [Mycena albidolilacea]
MPFILLSLPALRSRIWVLVSLARGSTPVPHTPVLAPVSVFPCSCSRSTLARLSPGRGGRVERQIHASVVR